MGDHRGQKPARPFVEKPEQKACRDGPEAPYEVPAVGTYMEDAEESEVSTRPSTGCSAPRKKASSPTPENTETRTRYRPLAPSTRSGASSSESRRSTGSRR